MEGSKNEDESIIYICDQITKLVGLDYFEEIDFWVADLNAIGLKRGEKLIYISSWDFVKWHPTTKKYYSEFEIIDSISFETKQTEKVFSEINEDELLRQVQLFLETA